MEKITTARGVWLGGICSGVLAGIAMAVFLIVVAAFAGGSFANPMQLIAGIFYGNAAASAGASSALSGLAFHLLISAVIGLIFASFIRYSTKTMAFFLGISMSILIWAVATFAVVPLLDPPLWRAVSSAMVSWFVAHLVFGGTLMITPAMVVRWSDSSSVSQLDDHVEYRKAA